MVLEALGYWDADYAEPGCMPDLSGHEQHFIGQFNIVQKTALGPCIQVGASGGYPYFNRGILVTAIPDQVTVLAWIHTPVTMKDFDCIFDCSINPDGNHSGGFIFFSKSNAANTNKWGLFTYNGSTPNVKFSGEALTANTPYFLGVTFGQSQQLVFYRSGSAVGSDTATVYTQPGAGGVVTPFFGNLGSTNPTYRSDLFLRRLIICRGLVSTQHMMSFRTCPDQAKPRSKRKIFLPVNVVTGPTYQDLAATANFNFILNEPDMRVVVENRLQGTATLTFNVESLGHFAITTSLHAEPITLQFSVIGDTRNDKYLSGLINHTFNVSGRLTGTLRMESTATLSFSVAGKLQEPTIAGPIMEAGMVAGQVEGLGINQSFEQGAIYAPGMDVGQVREG